MRGSTAALEAVSKQAQARSSTAETMKLPTSPRAQLSSSSPNWKSSQFNIRDLQAPAVFSDSKAPSPPPKRLATTSAVLSPRALAAADHISTVRALETYLKRELAPLPPGALQRLAAFRYAFSEIISALPIFGPLLSEIMGAYEAALDVSRRKADTSASAPRPLEALHPLQLPAAYYVAQWRTSQADLELARLQCKRLQKLVDALREGCGDALLRVPAVGAIEGVDPAGSSAGTGVARNRQTMAPPPTGGSAHGGAAHGGAAHGGVPTRALPPLPLERALAATQAVVNEELELAIDAELSRLRDKLQVLATRGGSAARLASRVAQSSQAARTQLEALVEESEARAAKGETADPTAVATANRALRSVLTTLQNGEAQAAKLTRLLAPGWETNELSTFVAELQL